MIHPILALPAALIPLIAAGVGAAASVGSALLSPKPKQPPAPIVPPAPAPIQQPQGTPPQTQSGTPSFLAAAAAPQQQQMGGKSLLGQ
jgi:hypothetical protein